ncbi:MAG: hypothetical protein AB7O68_05385 [Pirellulales bacterium]
MSRYVKTQQLIGTALVLFVASSLASGQQTEPPRGLVRFVSDDGGFEIRLPGKPTYEKTDVGDPDHPQHQFKAAAGEEGGYLVSYQDNPKLEGANAETLQLALKVGRDSVLKVFKGELVDSKEVKLDEKHPGIDFRVTIPQLKGEAHCRFYLVGSRLYQIMVIGVPDFVGSRQATRVIDSFRLSADEAPSE